MSLPRLADPEPRSVWPWLAVAVTPCLVSIWAVALALLGLFDVHPFWPKTPATLPEAVALQSGWEVVRQLGDGGDPDVRMSVRARILGARPTELSAWEAGVEANRAAVLQLMLDEGFRPGPAAEQGLVCRARGREAGDIMAILELAGLDVDSTCPEEVGQIPPP